MVVPFGVLKLRFIFESLGYHFKGADVHPQGAVVVPFRVLKFRFIFESLNWVSLQGADGTPHGYCLFIAIGIRVT